MTGFHVIYTSELYDDNNIIMALCTENSQYCNKQKQLCDNCNIIMLQYAEKSQYCYTQKYKCGITNSDINLKKNTLDTSVSFILYLL